MLKDQLVKSVEAYLAAYGAHDSAGCARTYAADGVLFSPFGPAARGRAAIAATHEEWFAENEQDKRLEVLEFQDNGESGHCVLAWSARVPDESAENGSRLESGVSLCVLSLRDGEVLFERMALVPDVA